MTREKEQRTKPGPMECKWLRATQDACCTQQPRKRIPGSIRLKEKAKCMVSAGHISNSTVVKEMVRQQVHTSLQGKHEWTERSKRDWPLALCFPAGTTLHPARGRKAGKTSETEGGHSKELLGTDTGSRFLISMDT